MKTIEDKTTDNFTNIRKPTYTINPELNKYDNIVLFPEKLAKANAQLAISGPPMLKGKKQSVEVKAETTEQSS